MGWKFERRPSGSIAVSYKGILIAVVESLEVAERILASGLREVQRKKEAAW